MQSLDPNKAFACIFIIIVIIMEYFSRVRSKLSYVGIMFLFFFFTSCMQLLFQSLSFTQEAFYCYFLVNKRFIEA